MKRLPTITLSFRSQPPDQESSIAGFSAEACTGNGLGTRLRFKALVCLALLFLLVMTACATPVTLAPEARAAAASETASHTATVTATFTPSPEPTETLTPTVTPTFTQAPTQTSTPEPLPIFTSRQIRGDAQPQTYVNDTCTYLARRWAPGNSSPGTIVVPVMFHSIVKTGRDVSDPKDISEEEFYSFMTYADRLGFKTITTGQLIGFLEENSYIPERSMIMILDDRRPGVIANQFMDVLEKYDWMLTLAYIADPNSMTWAMELVKEQYQTGRLDVQSHGFSGALYITKDSTEEEIRKEIEESTIALEQNFGQRPLAFIWPGGNFTPLAVQVARQDGYRLGFTAFSRGPLMFNWIPLGEKEREVNDPLMLLPRAWSNSIPVNLDIAVSISQEMAEYSAQSYAEEAYYYKTYCNGELPQR